MQPASTASTTHGLIREAYELSRDLQGHPGEQAQLSCLLANLQTLLILAAESSRVTADAQRCASPRLPGWPPRQAANDDAIDARWPD